MNLYFIFLFLSKAIKSVVQIHKMYCCLQASPVWKILPSAIPAWPVGCCCYPLKGVCGYYRLLSFKYDFLDKIVPARAAKWPCFTLQGLLKITKYKCLFLRKIFHFFTYTLYNFSLLQKNCQQQPSNLGVFKWPQL